MSTLQAYASGVQSQMLTSVYYAYADYPMIPVCHHPEHPLSWEKEVLKLSPSSAPPVVVEWNTEMDRKLLTFIGSHLPFVPIRLVRDQEHVLVGTVFDFIKVYGWTWCHQRQRGFLTMAIESKWTHSCKCPRSVEVPKPTEVPVEPQSVRVYLEALGPNLEDVISFAGVGPVLDSIPTYDQNYLICEGRGELRTLVPLEVKAVYLQKCMDSLPGRSVTAESYRETAMGTYSVWSYPVHVEQVRDIVKSVPADWTIIAPADGMGVIASAWKGPLVSGDRTSSPITHRSVVSEHIEETVMRGLCNKSKRVVIFSYCWGSVTEDVKTRLVKDRVPFIILQATDVIANLTLRHYGPGLFGSNLPDNWELHVHAYEKFLPSSSLLYSENLLNTSGYQVHSNSDYLKYVLGMRPLLPMVNHIMGEAPAMNEVDDLSLPHLATSLPELFTILFEYPRADIYFAPIGKRYSGAVAWDFYRGRESSSYLAPAREIIVVPTDWSFRWMVTTHFPHYEKGGGLFFYSATPRHLNLEASFVSQIGSKVIGRVDFVDRHALKEPIVKQGELNLLILSKTEALNLCKCMVGSEADIARVVCHFYPDGGAPLWFIQDVVSFVPDVRSHLDSWKSLKDAELVKRAKQSKLEVLSSVVPSHCDRFSPHCQHCMAYVRALSAPPKGCSCIHRHLFLLSSQAYFTKGQPSTTVNRTREADRIPSAITSTPEPCYKAYVSPWASPDHIEGNDPYAGIPHLTFVPDEVGEGLISLSVETGEDSED